ncbi:DNA replication complex GINS protein PSF1-like [Sycon ciliatum]|uniref:DNA replication complex GINS protein PSF1-like n=1 Tax=Sycon ciliatum TaxID=27933 RepID=UPI0031F6281D
MSMFGDRAVELLKELQRCENRDLPPYNDDEVRQILEEVRALYDQNCVEAAEAGQKEEGQLLLAGIYARHAAIERNKRCLLAYIYNRMQRLRLVRWNQGSIIPAELREALNDGEIDWFGKYSRSLATYMQSVGDTGVDLTQHLKPPKNLFIEVRCVQDYGEMETEDGHSVQLAKNSQHYLRRTDCEQLIHQGVLEQIS